MRLPTTSPTALALTMTTHPALTSVSALVPWGSALVLPGNGRKTAVPIGTLNSSTSRPTTLLAETQRRRQFLDLVYGKLVLTGARHRKGDVWNIRPLCAFAHRCGDLGWSLSNAHGLEHDVQEPLKLHRLNLSPQDSHDLDVAVACAFAPCSHNATADEINAASTAKPGGFAEIVAKVKPAVIAVTVRLESSAQMESEESDAPSRSQPFSENSPLHRHFFGSPQRQPSPARIRMALGSGFFVSSDGCGDERSRRSAWDFFRDSHPKMAL